MAYEIDWRPGAIEDVQALFDYLAESASVQVAVEVTDRILRSTDRLAEFPRLYQADPRYGDDVRRISLIGQHVLYEVNDRLQVVQILAVVGQRQDPRSARQP